MKIKLTRPELKNQRDALRRFERYLPMLKLKQQQLQAMVREAQVKLAAAQTRTDAARTKFESYRAVLEDNPGMNFIALAKPETIDTHIENVAGVKIPVFNSVSFPAASYSLFSTPVWVDAALTDQRDLSRCEVEHDILNQQYALLERELTKIVQRVNLFDKVKIPDCKEAIRRIRIHLGDEMTAGVGRAKIAKTKLDAKTRAIQEATA
ncbi:MAG: V-type ATP synthase subunit D [Phycisphaerales bacterium]|jgi:V/A-type H+/Na+-transporting ATPase subunit D|nr:V-type ATP synthase subunit D [Phycisphaerales bacterium]